MFERGHVATDLARIFDRDARLFVELEEHQVREGGLRSLDHRGEDGLLADETVEKQFRVGQQVRHRVEPTDGQECRVEAGSERRRPFDGGPWRGRRRNERAEGFVAGGELDVMAL